MRICYITNSAIPSTSANSIATTKICEAFSELKNDVILITEILKILKIFLNFMTLNLNLKLKRLNISINFNQGS